MWGHSFAIWSYYYLDTFLELLISFYPKKGFIAGCTKNNLLLYTQIRPLYILHENNNLNWIYYFLLNSSRTELSIFYLKVSFKMENLCLWNSWHTGCSFEHSTKRGHYNNIGVLSIWLKIFQICVYIFITSLTIL